MARQLKFQTERKRKAVHSRKLIVAFCLFVLFFAATSVFLMLRHYNFDLSNMFEGRETTTSEEETTAAVYPELNGCADFLLCGTGSKSALRFVSVVRADLGARLFTVCPLSPKERVTLGGENLSLLEHFQNGGMTQLTSAVEALGSTKISRYILGSDTGFKDAVNAMGGLTVSLKERIEYRSEDLFFVLPPGKQTLKGDILLKYMRYCSLNGDEGLDASADIIALMLDQYFSAENVENGDSLFTSLINKLDSNVSIVDFASYKSVLAALVESGQLRKAKTVQYLADLPAAATPTDLN